MRHGTRCLLASALFAGAVGCGDEGGTHNASAAGSLVVNAADPAQSRTDDILRAARGPSPDIGAVEAP